MWLFLYLIETFLRIFEFSLPAHSPYSDFFLVWTKKFLILFYPLTLYLWLFSDLLQRNFSFLLPLIPLLATFFRFDRKLFLNFTKHILFLSPLIHLFSLIWKKLFLIFYFPTHFPTRKFFSIWVTNLSPIYKSFTFASHLSLSDFFLVWAKKVLNFRFLIFLLPPICDSFSI